LDLPARDEGEYNDNDRGEQEDKTTGLQSAVAIGSHAAPEEHSNDCEQNPEASEQGEEGAAPRPNGRLDTRCRNIHRIETVLADMCLHRPT
jgi:hypothetical protein